MIQEFYILTIADVCGMLNVENKRIMGLLKV